MTKKVQILFWNGWDVIWRTGPVCVYLRFKQWKNNSGIFLTLRDDVSVASNVVKKRTFTASIKVNAQEFLNLVDIGSLPLICSTPKETQPLSFSSERPFQLFPSSDPWLSMNVFSSAAC